MIKAKAKLPRTADVSRAKGYVDRVKALIEQQKEIGGDISDVCTEAKEIAGLEPTMIRFAAREMLIDKAKRDERNEKRDLYLHAVGLAVAAVESGEVSVRQAAKIYSIGKTSVYNALAVRDVSATVEMTADDLGTLDLAQNDIQREMTADDLGDPMWVTDKPRAQFREKIRTLAATLKVPQEVGAGDPRPEGTSEDLTIPSFLDVRKTVSA